MLNILEIVAALKRGEYPTFRFVNSTAKERAIAFLKIIGKWD